MMKNIKNSTFNSLVFLSLLSQAGCTQQSLDAELKADITSKAKADVNFAGVQFTVDKANVSLTGSCPTVKSKDALLKQLGTIHMIEHIEDHLTISPVVLGSSFTLKQQVDSLLSKYPGVKAAVSDTMVVLQGKIKNADLEKLLPAVVKLHPQVKADQLIKEI